jgi:hypothetical protein
MLTRVLLYGFRRRCFTNPKPFLDVYQHKIIIVNLETGHKNTRALKVHTRKIPEKKEA